MTDIEYLRGKLSGIQSLIVILKDAMESGEVEGSEKIVSTLVSHISKELEQVVKNLEEEEEE